MNHASAPPPTTTSPPRPPNSARRVKRRDGFCPGGGVPGVGEGSWVSGSTAASTTGAASEVRVEPGAGGERAVKSSDCERTGVRVGAEGGRDRSVPEVEDQAGPLPLACSRALANACRLAKGTIVDNGSREPLGWSWRK